MINNESVKYYIVQEKTFGGTTETKSMYIDTTNNIITTAANFDYATSFNSEEDANAILNLVKAFSQLNENASATIEYFLVKRTVKTELVEGVS